MLTKEKVEQLRKEAAIAYLIEPTLRNFARYDAFCQVLEESPLGIEKLRGEE